MALVWSVCAGQCAVPVPAWLRPGATKAFRQELLLGHWHSSPCGWGESGAELGPADRQPVWLFIVEILNTAVSEAVVDRIGLERHDLSRPGQGSRLGRLRLPGDHPSCPGLAAGALHLTDEPHRYTSFSRLFLRAPRGLYLRHAQYGPMPCVPLLPQGNSSPHAPAQGLPFIAHFPFGTRHKDSATRSATRLIVPVTNAASMRTRLTRVHHMVTSRTWPTRPVPAVGGAFRVTSAIACCAEQVPAEHGDRPGVRILRRFF